LFAPSHETATADDVIRDEEEFGTAVVGMRKSQMQSKVGTSEASRFYSNSIGRPDSIRFKSDGPIQKFRIARPATFAVVP